MEERHCSAVPARRPQREEGTRDRDESKANRRVRIREEPLEGSRTQPAEGSQVAPSGEEGAEVTLRGEEGERLQKRASRLYWNTLRQRKANGGVAQSVKTGERNFLQECSSYLATEA